MGAAIAAVLLSAVAPAGADPTVSDVLAKPHSTLIGASDDFAGNETLPAGDVNGDGHADLLVAGNSRAWVVFGPLAGHDVPLDSPGNGGFVIDASAIWNFVGMAVAPAGDVNGDGKADIVVGIRSADNNARSDSGSAFVVFGDGSSVPVVLPDLGSRGFRIDGAGAGDQLGESVAGAGDVNGDGLDDVVVGTEGMGNQRTGRSGYVVFGRDSTATVAVNSATLGDRGFRLDGNRTDRPGAAVAGVGDVNGDGRDDILIGAPWAGNNARPASGSVYLVLGRAASAPVALDALGSGVLRIDGAHGGDYLGSALAAAGDVNGDGRPDLLLGAPAADLGGGAGAGAAYVVFGGSSTGIVDLSGLGAAGLAITSGGFPDDLGRAVAPAGDMNGDGYDDVLVGAPGTGWQGQAVSGAAYLVPGGPAGGSVDAARLGSAGRIVAGASADDHLGASVGGGQDLTGDGHPDLLIGAPRADVGGARNHGTAHVLDDLSSAFADPGAAAPESHVVLNASFFRPGEAVAAVLDGRQVARTNADDSGRATLAAAIPAATAGARPITVTGAASGFHAEAAFTVLAPAAITLSPASGLPSSTVSVTGGRFGPGENVLIRFDSASVGWVHADNAGRLAAARFAVPRGAVVGTHAVTALGDSSGTSAPASFRVTLPVWSQWGFYSTHVGANPYETLLDRISVAGLVRRCSATLPASAGASSPAVGGSRAIVGSADGSVRAVSMNGCAAKWTASIGPGAATSPAIARGVVYAGSADGGLSALDQVSGRERWHSPAHGGMSGAPVTTTDRVLAGFRDGTLESVDQATGVARWTRALAAPVTVAPAAGSGKVFAATSDGGLAALDAAGGSTTWSVKLPAVAAASPVLVSGHLLIAGADKSLRSFKSGTGAPQWVAALDDGTGSAPAVAGTVVVAGSSSGLAAFDLGSGRRVWLTQLAGPVTSSPVTANGVVYAVAGANLVAVAASTGELLFSAALGGAGSSPVVLGGRVYVATAAGQLVTFGL